MTRKLILRNGQSPGDIVMLTAAVATDMRTPCPAVLASLALLPSLLPVRVRVAFNAPLPAPA